MERSGSPRSGVPPCHEGHPQLQRSHLVIPVEQTPSLTCHSLTDESCETVVADIGQRPTVDNELTYTQFTAGDDATLMRYPREIVGP